MSDKVRLVDIAAALGVSVATVSRALLDRSDISEPMKQQVRETAQRMGYIPDAPAASMRTGRTGTIAVIISDIANPYLAFQVQLIERTARSYGYSTVVLGTEEVPENERQAITTALRQRVDGILICPVQSSPSNLSMLADSGVPFVLIGRYFPGFSADAVLCDDRQGGFLITRHLISMGKRRILFLSAPEEYTVGRDREWGYRAAYTKAGLTPDPSLIRRIPVTSGHVADTLEQVLAERLSFDALLGFSDLLTFEAKRILLQRIGTAAEQLMFAGFDAVQSHLSLPIPFSSVSTVAPGWAEPALALLIEKIDRPHIPRPAQCIRMEVRLYNF